MIGERALGLPANPAEPNSHSESSTGSCNDASSSSSILSFGLAACGSGGKSSSPSNTNASASSGSAQITIDRSFTYHTTPVKAGSTSWSVKNDSLDTHGDAGRRWLQRHDRCRKDGHLSPHRHQRNSQVPLQHSQLHPNVDRHRLSGRPPAIQQHHRRTDEPATASAIRSRARSRALSGTHTTSTTPIAPSSTWRGPCSRASSTNTERAKSATGPQPHDVQAFDAEQVRSGSPKRSITASGAGRCSSIQPRGAVQRQPAAGRHGRPPATAPSGATSPDSHTSSSSAPTPSSSPRRHATTGGRSGAPMYGVGRGAGAFGFQRRRSWFRQTLPI